MNLRLLLAAALLSAASLPASGQTAEQWIARARARLGSESALQALTSIRYTGRLKGDSLGHAISTALAIAAAALPAPTTSVFPLGGCGRWRGTICNGSAAASADLKLSMRSSLCFNACANQVVKRQE